MAKTDRLWSSLSKRTKQNYKRQGVTPAMYNARWDKLADSTRRKYERNGVTRNLFNDPKRHVENRDLFSTARGKGPVPYMAQRAQQVGLLPKDRDLRLVPKRELDRELSRIQAQLPEAGRRFNVFERAKFYGMDSKDQVIPFSKLSPDQQLTAAELWNRVMDTREHEREDDWLRRKKDLKHHPFNKYREVDFVNAKTQFLGWLDEQGVSTDVEDWQFFRELYKSAFA